MDLEVRSIVYDCCLCIDHETAADFLHSTQQYCSYVYSAVFLEDNFEWLKFESGRICWKKTIHN